MTTPLTEAETERRYEHVGYLMGVEYRGIGRFKHADPNHPWVVYYCADCGGAVLDRPVHDRFHEEATS